MYAVLILPNSCTSWRAIDSAEDLLPGEQLADMPPQPSLADAVATLMPAVQAWMDQTAQASGYDSLASCISYRGSSVAQWDTDAGRALAWRDAVWVAAFQWQQSAAASPPSTFPTSAEVIADLPQPQQFGWVVHAPGASGAAQLAGSV